MTIQESAIKVTDSDADKIASIEVEISKAHRDLGSLREDFLNMESQLLSRLVHLQRTMQETVIETGKSYDVNIDPASQTPWRYDLSTKAFVRLG